MRQFTAQPMYGDEETSPPPPPYSVDREATRVMPVYLNQYRDGRHRLPTPEKVAVMELSSSFERRRLGKHQRILNDISQRCREQEVSDLSNNLSMKLHLQKLNRQDREVTFYSTTFMGPKKRLSSTFMDQQDSVRSAGQVDVDLITVTSRPTFDKAYKHFPARRIMRQQTKFDFLKSTTNLPKLQGPLPKSSVSDSSGLRPQPVEKFRDDSMQLEQITTPPSGVPPLILPKFEHLYNTPVNTERLDRMDTYFSASRLRLGQRTRTQLTIDSGRQAPSVRPSAPAVQTKNNTDNFNREYSQLQMTTGHSPPPNSVQEPESTIV